eukprot:4617377-Prymnesium_polylepis.1
MAKAAADNWVWSWGKLVAGGQEGGLAVTPAATDPKAATPQTASAFTSAAAAPFSATAASSTTATGNCGVARRDTCSVQHHAAAAVFLRAMRRRLQLWMRERARPDVGEPQMSRTLQVG